MIVLEPHWTGLKNRVEHADIVAFEKAEALARKLFEDDLATALENWREDFEDQMPLDDFLSDYGGEGYRAYHYLIEAYEDGSLDSRDVDSGGPAEEVRHWRFDEPDWRLVTPKA